jgi:hypothetical protein
MKLSQHYLVAQRNVIVEGVDDYWIIMELNNLVIRSGMEGLPDDVMITAAGGASEAVYLSTFMIGQGLQTVTLFDGDEEGRRQEERLRTKWLTKYKGNQATTVLINAAMGVVGDAAIEDLFEESYYVQHANTSHQEKLRNAGPKTIVAIGTGLLCDRVSHGCERLGIAFNKGSVAKLIKRDLIAAKSISDFPDTTRDKAVALMAALRRALDPTVQSG